MCVNVYESLWNFDGCDWYWFRWSTCECVACVRPIHACVSSIQWHDNEFNAWINAIRLEQMMACHVPVLAHTNCIISMAQRALRSSCVRLYMCDTRNLSTEKWKKKCGLCSAHMEIRWCLTWTSSDVIRMIIFYNDMDVLRIYSCLYLGLVVYIDAFYHGKLAQSLRGCVVNYTQCHQT